MYYEINVSKRIENGFNSEGKKYAPEYRHFFATAPRSCTSQSQLKKVLKEIVEKFPKPAYEVMVTYNSEQIEGVNVNEVLGITPDFSPNKMVEMFDIAKVKQQIKDCQKDECVILCNNWSINRPKYTEDEALDGLQEADWDNFEELIGFPIEINQYDDLIVDPYGIVD